MMLLQLLMCYESIVMLVISWLSVVVTVMTVSILETVYSVHVIGASEFQQRLTTLVV